MAIAVAPMERRAEASRSRGGLRRGEVNVGKMERMASLLGGGALAAYGLTRGSLGGLALAALGGSLLYRGATGHCHVYGALGINTAGPRGSQASIPAGAGVKVRHSILIDRPAEELFRVWRDFRNMPRWSRHLESVAESSPTRSHWVARGPMGKRVEWESEIITERPNELIGWRSLPGSDVDTAGSVHFRPAPDGRGTEVEVVLKYDPPDGKGAAGLLAMFGTSPEEEIREDLQHFKEVMESGGVHAGA